jgi:4-nitrophenyl phosphatase
VRQYKLYIFDLDGTLYRGETPLPGAIETLLELEKRGSNITFFTNNSSRTQKFFADKISNMGYPCKPEQVMTSALLAAKKVASLTDSAFVVGEEGIYEALSEHGIRTDSPNSNAVVCGIDRNFTYEKLSDALQVLLKPESHFIATNADKTYPLEGGKLIPGAGSLVASLEAASGRTATVCGKPNPDGIFAILEQYNVAPSDTLVVGDRIDTDILSGQCAKCDVHLVLTGVTLTAPEGISASTDITSLV